MTTWWGKTGWKIAYATIVIGAVVELAIIFA